MPDSDKAPWQAVQEEPADKLHRRDGDRVYSLFFSIFGREGHHAVFKVFDPAVGNGHPVGIACQIFQNMFRTLDRLAYTDHPALFIQHVPEVVIGPACKFDVAGFADMLHFLNELTAKGS